MIVYDPPGEAFNSDSNIERYAGFVAYSSCVLFLISLADMRPPVSNDMYRLLEIYILGVKNLGGKAKTQHLVVVFTKADLLVEEFGLPQPLRDYLEQPELDAQIGSKAYKDQLANISRQLRDFTANELGAQNFLNLVRSHFKSVDFTIISSLGDNPRDGRLDLEASPRRVIDPFLTALAYPQTISAPSRPAQKEASPTATTPSPPIVAPSPPVAASSPSAGALPALPVAAPPKAAAKRKGGNRWLGCLLTLAIVCGGVYWMLQSAGRATQFFAASTPTTAPVDAAEASASQIGNPDNEGGAASNGDEITIETRVINTGSDLPLRVRSGPGTDNAILVRLPNGSTVEMLDERETNGDSTWVKIRYDGGEGWVDESLLGEAQSLTVTVTPLP